MSAAPLRVAGADPGTSSLDLLILEDGHVADQMRFSPQELGADPTAPVTWLTERGPLALVAGPSGYGVPLVANSELTDDHVAQMTLVRPDEAGTAQGVLGFRATLRAFRAAPFPVVFLPGVIHLPTVPEHRKFNRIDLGTPDKLCVAALASLQSETCCVVELGTAFTACVVVEDGRIVDGIGGSAGPVGWQAHGAWDGEFAYLLSPLKKSALFRGGAAEVPREVGSTWFAESLHKTVAGLRAVTAFNEIIVAGRLAETEPEVAARATAALAAVAPVRPIQGLANAWVKHAAQGAAVIAAGLVGGTFAPVVEGMQLRAAGGTVVDWLVPPRAESGAHPTSSRILLSPEGSTQSRARSRPAQPVE